MEEIQKKYKRHIFVCVNSRENRECCSARDSMQILNALREHINRNGLFHSFNVSKSLCLGHCSEGPTIAIYPDGRMFKRVSMADVGRIIREYISE